MIIRVIDFETRGLPPDDCQIVEAATIDLTLAEDGMWHRGRSWQTLINPGRPIPPQASAVHHIVDDMVADAPRFEDVEDKITADGPVDAFAAHNAKFEKTCWPNANGHQWIDTYKLGVVLWPESPSHSNQCLRYFLKLRLADPALAEPHRALGDAYVSAAILRRAFASFEIDVDQMIEISLKPVELPRLRFGKWAGKPIEEIESGYLKWLINQADMDEDVLYTARLHLDRRATAARKRSPVQISEGARS